MRWSKDGDAFVKGDALFIDPETEETLYQPINKNNNPEVYRDLHSRERQRQSCVYLLEIEVESYRRAGDDSIFEDMFEGQMRIVDEKGDLFIFGYTVDGWRCICRHEFAKFGRTIRRAKFSI